MCGMSGIELLVVLAVAVIFVGPEHLPEMFRSAGKLMREVRRMTGDIGQVTREIRSSVNIDDLRSQLKAEMAAERERFRLLSQELEIDALKARKGAGTANAANRAASGALMTAAAGSTAAPAAADAPVTSDPADSSAIDDGGIAATAGIQDTDPADAPLPPLPAIRPARHAVEAASPATESRPAAPAPGADEPSGDPA